MPLELLLSKTKHKESTDDKQKILYDQKNIVEGFFQKLSIDKYLLLIEKGDSFSIAANKGYEQNLKNKLVISRNYLIIEQIYEEGLISIADVLNYYNSCLLITKEHSKQINKERTYWDELQVNYFLPIFTNEKLIGLLVFHSTKSLAKSKILSELQDGLKNWSKGLCKKLDEQNIKETIDSYKTFFDIVSKASSLESTEDIQEEIFFYVLNLIKSESAIWFTVKDSYVTPIKFKNVGFIKSYSKKELASILTKKHHKIINKKIILGKEFSKGLLQIIPINKNNIIFAKINAILPENEMLKIICQLTGRLLECQKKSKPQSTKKLK